ncbi:hypothetical protein GCM10009843_32240 [Nocardioides bigeumensis]|uniref:Uncharacterized protein n=1 Tax=Nocardioides bigeumensis TaxID=433657 RepID=A0ABP5KFV2_9ACTN
MLRIGLSDECVDPPPVRHGHQTGVRAAIGVVSAQFAQMGADRDEDVKDMLVPAADLARLELPREDTGQTPRVTLSYSSRVTIRARPSRSGSQGFVWSPGVRASLRD